MARKLKRGEQYVVVRDTCSHCIPMGTMITLIGEYPNDYNDGWRQNYSTCYVREDDLESIYKNKYNVMDLKEKFVMLFKSEPVKSFRKAGIVNGDDMLTEEGTALFLSWMLTKNGEAFKTEVVDELLKKEEVK